MNREDRTGRAAALGHVAHGVSDLGLMERWGQSVLGWRSTGGRKWRQWRRGAEK